VEHLSDRVQRIKPSATLAVTARAKALKAAGEDIIVLAAGEPDFDTPEHVKQAAIDAIHAGFTKYTAVDGIPDLKAAIIDKFKRDNNLDYQADEILVSCGGKHSYYNLIQALISPGDEVIIPAPYWTSYPDIVLLGDGKPVIIGSDIDAGFKITAVQLEAAITPKTRLLILNSPSNPTGASYQRDELLALAEVLLRHPQVMVMTDDIYEHITFTNEPFVNIVNVCPDLKDRCIVLNGVSKTYSMTGWRIGFAAGSSWLIKAMTKIQSQSTSNPTSISQVAAQAALAGDQNCITDMLTAFRERHEFVVSGLNAIKGIHCIASQGAFYSFPDCQEAINSLDGVNNDAELAEYLITQAGIALVPGTDFGAPGYLRLSFATSKEELEKALTRLGDILGYK
jgi:aspartate aminotransferase